MGNDPQRITKELIKLVDERTINPRIRAKIVWDALKDKELHSWSVVCFCVEYLKRVAVDLEYMKDPMKELSSLVYHQHYMFPENLGIIVSDDMKELTKRTETKDELQSEQEKSD